MAISTGFTVEFLGVWELNNRNSNPVEFDGIRMQTGLDSFTSLQKTCFWGTPLLN